MLLDELRTEEDRSEALKIRGFTDLELFCSYYFHHYCEHDFNEFHVDRFQSHDPFERKRRRVRAAPRGTAKSVFATVIEPIHAHCYGYEYFIAILSNTAPQAIAKLKDVRTELLTNKRLIDDFGIYFPVKKPGATEFVACAEIDGKIHETKFAGFGWGAEIRGIRFGTKRPSLIICDDVEHSTQVFNEEIRNKDSEHFNSVVAKIGDEKTNIDFVGTVLHRDSLLVKLMRNPAYEAKLYKSIVRWATNQELWDQWQAIYINLDDPYRKRKANEFYHHNEEALLLGTEVLWECKEPYLELMKEMVEIGKRAFMKEKQNEPLGAEDKVFEQIHWYREQEEGLYIINTDTLVPWENLVNMCKGALDPSGGQNPVKKGKLGDFASLVTGYSLPNIRYYDDDEPDTGDEDEWKKFGRLFVHDAWLSRVPPTKQIKSIFDHHKKYNYQDFGVETNMYRNLMLPNISDEKVRREQASGDIIHLKFYDIENTENKIARITNIEPKVSNGYILFNVALCQEFKNQLEEFPHADHDDGPDSLEMLWGMHTKRYKAAPLPTHLMGG